VRILLLSFLACSLVGCRPSVPEIGRDLPSSYEEGERIFDARLKRRFPIGSAEGDLVAEAERQGFSVVRSDHGSFATFSNKAFPVQSVWNIGWKAKDGRIEDVWGIYGGRGP
jgi:hypothetical protein